VDGGEVKVRIKDNQPTFEIVPSPPKAPKAKAAKPKKARKTEKPEA